MRLIVSLFLAFGLAACASQKSQPVPPDNTRAATSSSAPTGNPYTDTFVSHPVSGQAQSPDPAGPKIYRGRDKEADYRSMLENGYDLIGYSSFEAGDVPPERLADQAKQAKADMVLVYTQLVGNTPASIKMQRLRDAMLKKKQGGIATEDAPAEGQADTDAKELYSYFASYWVKLAPPLLGVHVNGPDKNGNAPGLPVVAVVRESPADKAGIVDGDVLTKLGEVSLDKPETLTKAARQYAGKTVPVSFSRGGVPSQVDVTLSGQP